MTRGEIWLVDFGVPIGSEAGYKKYMKKICKGVIEVLELEEAL
ncbi:hypothetical protein [Treponema sp. UBA3813]|nr:hypothetical protein [Treponema sp. UBA3813]